MQLGRSTSGRCRPLPDPRAGARWAAACWALGERLGAGPVPVPPAAVPPAAVPSAATSVPVTLVPLAAERGVAETPPVAAVPEPAASVVSLVAAPGADVLVAVGEGAVPSVPTAGEEASGRPMNTA